MWGNQTIDLDDILVEMDKNLRKNAFEQKTSRANSRLQALELLNKAANIFENAGLTKEADAIVRIMEIAQTEKPVSRLAKKAQIESEIEVEEAETPEESRLYEMLMSDPNIALEVAVDEKGKEEIDVPSEEMLAAMW
jgi:hypothetical protein